MQYRYYLRNHNNNLKKYETNDTEKRLLQEVLKNNTSEILKQNDCQNRIYVQGETE